MKVEVVHNRMLEKSWIMRMENSNEILFACLLCQIIIC